MTKNDDWLEISDERIQAELGEAPEPPLDPTIKMVLTVGLSTFFVTMFADVPEPTRSIACIATTAVAGVLTYWHYHSQHLQGFTERYGPAIGAFHLVPDQGRSFPDLNQ